MVCSQFLNLYVHAETCHPYDVSPERATRVSGICRPSGLLPKQTCCGLPVTQTFCDPVLLAVHELIMFIVIFARCLFT